MRRERRASAFSFWNGNGREGHNRSVISDLRCGDWKGGVRDPGAGKKKGADKKEKKYPTPARTYKRSLPKIAEALAEQARKGSYLHARALKEIVDAEQAKRGQTTRREERWVKELLEKLEDL